MKRISPEKSRLYVSLEENREYGRIDRPKFYTITPSPNPQRAKDGWEEVTYFTSRRKFFRSKIEGEGNSWVYVMSNSSFPHMFKIGHTTELPEVRAKQLSSPSGIPTPFRVEWAYKCFDSHLLEPKIHKILEEYRVNNQREFFQVDLEEAKRVIISTLNNN